MGRLDPVIKSSIVHISFFGKHLLREFTQSDDSESRPGNPISERRTARETAPALSPPEFSAPTTPRRNSKSRTEEDRPSWRREWERRSRRLQSEAYRPAISRFALARVRRLCSNCHCERGARVTLMEPATLSRLQFGDSMLAAEPAMRLASKCQASDGSALWWGGTDTPGPPQMVAPGTAAPVVVAISPMRPGHSVAVEYRVNGGPVREAIGVIEPRIQDAKARIFRAIVPGQSDGLVEFLPVLRFAGQPISTRLSELAECPRYQVGNGVTPIETSKSPPRIATSVVRVSLAVDHEIPWGLHDPAAQGSGRRAGGRTADQLAL